MLRRIGHGTNWTSISAGSYNSLAVKSDGTLWVWGRNLPSLAASYSPVMAAPGNDWKQAMAGGVISAGLKKDGTLWAWGHNWCGAVGDGSTNDRTSPVQIGTATNWVKVRGGILETVGLQSDGSLWYWGENPDPAFAQGVNSISSPRRVSADTNWVDMGFGVNTVFAIKADGTLWTWGRHAERYTGATNIAQNATPTRIGTNSDWASICSTDWWWITGLTKKDGSMWLMDASSANNNAPPKPYQPVNFRRVDFGKDCVAYAGGSAHAAPSGVHGCVMVILTREGEVWTSGMVLGDPPTMKSRLSAMVAKFVRLIQRGKRIQELEPDPKYHEQPWQLRNDGGE
jgi:alpha-tubulin suppressor-like RCC1 family protein